MSRRNTSFEMDACPVCGSFDTDDPCGCDYCEVDGGPLEPRRYVAVDSLLAVFDPKGEGGLHAAVAHAIGVASANALPSEVS